MHGTSQESGKRSSRQNLWRSSKVGVDVYAAGQGGEVQGRVRGRRQLLEESETRDTSQIINRTSHVTRHTSHVTRHTSHVTRHTSHVKRVAVNVTCTSSNKGRGGFTPQACKCVMSNSGCSGSSNSRSSSSTLAKSSDVAAKNKPSEMDDNGV